MVKTDFHTIKELLLQSIDNGIEAELTLYINNKTYMIIIYNDYCSFQRCSAKDGSGESIYQSLDELYRAKQIDGIVLERDWDKIDDMNCFDFQIQNFW